jgi:DNA polymerase III sliding clamp (beta) subunit (PCNA family)
MKDITPFLSNSTIKPELMHVYVNDGHAVATDSFRLIEIKLDDFCAENIPSGYYSATKWKTMCKAYAKRDKDIETFMRTVQENAIYADTHKDFNYPSYKNVIPTADKLSDFNPDVKFNLDYFVDFLKVVAGTTDVVDFAKIKTDGNMAYFENDTTKLLLMKINR